jgi:hypothetical protein
MPYSLCFHNQHIGGFDARLHILCGSLELGRFSGLGNCRFGWGGRWLGDGCEFNAACVNAEPCWWPEFKCRFGRVESRSGTGAEAWTSRKLV